jgi:uncharacterized protein YjbI with pentapeptide repeats
LQEQRAVSTRGTVLIKLTLTALTVVAALVANGAAAFEPADLQKLKDTGNCVECDLFNSILSGANLSRAYLNGAWLRKANPSEADLTGTIMNGVILCNTTMPDGSVNDSGC